MKTDRTVAAGSLNRLVNWLHFLFGPWGILIHRPEVPFRITYCERLATVFHRLHFHDDVRFRGDSSCVHRCAIVHNQVEWRAHASANVRRRNIQMPKRTLIAHGSQHHHTGTKSQLRVSYRVTRSVVDRMPFKTEYPLEPCNGRTSVLVSQAWHQE